MLTPEQAHRNLEANANEDCDRSAVLDDSRDELLRKRTAKNAELSRKSNNASATKRLRQQESSTGSSGSSSPASCTESLHQQESSEGSLGSSSSNRSLSSSIEDDDDYDHSSENQVNALVNNAPFNNAPFNNAPFNNAPFNNAPFNNAPFNNAPFNDALVNNIVPCATHLNVDETLFLNQIYNESVAASRSILAFRYLLLNKSEESARNNMLSSYKIATLEGENINLKINLQVSEYKIAELEAENINLKTNAQASEYKISSLEAENINLKTEAQASKDKISELKAENINIKINAQASEYKIRSLEAENINLKTEAQAKEDKIAALELEKAKLIADAETHEQRNAEINAELTAENVLISAQNARLSAENVVFEEFGLKLEDTNAKVLAEKNHVIAIQAEQLVFMWDRSQKLRADLLFSTPIPPAPITSPTNSSLEQRKLSDEDNANDGNPAPF